LSVAGQEFRAGDDVIARQQDRTLRPTGTDATRFVRNADRGTITAVDLAPNSVGVWVDFEHRGEVFVPRSFLETEIRRGVIGGLTHAYALTSHAEQGETYGAGRHLATDRSSTEGVYVGLTRGRDDVRLYAVLHHDLTPRADDDPELPRLRAETRDVADSVRARLNTSSAERPALDHDRDALEIARLRQQHRPRQLHELAGAEGPDSSAQRAWDDEKIAIGASTCRRPDPHITNLLGPRPEPGARRVVWDQAVIEIACYRATHLDHTTPDARADWSDVNTAIDRARHYLDDRHVIDLRHDPAPVAGHAPVPAPTPGPAPVPAFALER